MSVCLIFLSLFSMVIFSSHSSFHLVQWNYFYSLNIVLHLTVLGLSSSFSAVLLRFRPSSHPVSDSANRDKWGRFGNSVFCKSLDYPAWKRPPLFISITDGEFSSSVLLHPHPNLAGTLGILLSRNKARRYDSRSFFLSPDLSLGIDGHHLGF